MFVRGTRVGTEAITVTRTAGGWRLASTGSLGSPYNLTNSKFDLTYTPDWQPQRLAIEGAVGATSLSLAATFSPTTVTVDLARGMQRGSTTQPVSARTIVLPDYFFAGYEALTARLADAAAGARFPVYLAPQVESGLTVTALSIKQLATPAGPVSMRQVEASIAKPGGAQAIELWIDQDNHLARLVVPAEGLTVIRDDLASIAIRELRVPHPGDQDVFIPATGFNLAATLTRPAGAAGRLPAIVLVGPQGTQDRDEITDGVPVFGRLAAAIADAGFTVVRYDKRGTGQSGGRTEHATLATYAEDVVHVITWLRRRKDVDSDRLAVVGYGEGGPIALLAAEREKRIRAVALLGSPGRTGREVVLEQQAQELAALPISADERARRSALQRRIIDALTIGGSWDQVPAGLRQQADTPWFRSWLLFDPAPVMRRVDKPILILHGGADTRVPVAHADALEALAAARKRPVAHTRKTIVPGAGPLLVDTEAGGSAGQSTAEQRLSPGVTSALTSWLRDVLPER